MTIPQTPRIKVAYLIAQAELLPSVLFGERGAVLALPKTHNGAAAAIRSMLGGSRKSALLIGTRVFSITCDVIHHEELRGCRDFCN